MTLPTFWIWSMPPVMPALVPGTPAIVVFAGTPSRRTGADPCGHRGGGDDEGTALTEGASLL
ncbi:hypothetical protein ABT189_06670 [Streptomyces sp900105755]|uniref:hypothetical protein n=1 Tax=Streptomyces sp. 900105755 TaxID=3154389 RepID=UPI003325D3D1